FVVQQHIERAHPVLPSRDASCSHLEPNQGMARSSSGARLEQSGKRYALEARTEMGEVLTMKAIVVSDQAAGTAGMTLEERPAPNAAINDVVVEIYASGFVPTELGWPSTWTDRADRDRTPSIPGHELAGVVTARGYGTTGVSIGQRVFGLADWHRD